MTRLRALLDFASVPAGATVALAHGLNEGGRAVVPNVLLASTGGFTATADATNVTVTNTGALPASVLVLAWRWHSIERAFGGEGVTALVPEPFVAGGGGIGGGGTATQVAFFTGAAVIGSDADLYWDNVNKRLGVRTALPMFPLDVTGSIHASLKVLADTSIEATTFLSGARATLPEQGADPAATANSGHVYTKEVAGVTELFYRADDGTISRLSSSTPSTPAAWIDDGSIVPGDLGLVDWATLWAAQAPKVRPIDGADAAGGRDLWLLNYDKATAGSGLLAYRFYAPITGTVRVTMPARLLAGDVGDTIALAVIADDLSAWVASLTIPLTALLTTYTMDVPVVAGTLYKLVVATNYAAAPLSCSAQARAVVGRILATPLNATRYTRIGLRDGARIVKGNVYTLGYGGAGGAGTGNDHRYLSPHAYVDLELSDTARRLEIEWVQNDATARILPVRVDGRYLGDVSAPAGAAGTVGRGGIDLLAGAKRVRVDVSSQHAQNNFPAGTPESGEFGGAIVRAIYVPSGGVSRVPEGLSTRRILCYGDSIWCTGAAVMGAESCEALMRDYAPGDTIMEAAGSRALAGDAPNAAAARAFARKLARVAPTDVYLQIGLNDWVTAAGWASAAAFGVAYAALLDELATACAGARLWCQSPLTFASEGVANGAPTPYTIADVRTQISTAAAARPTTCTYIDGLPIATYPADFADTAHLTSNGHAKWFAALRAAMGW